MSTSNFSTPTLSKHYVICMGDCEEWEYDEEISNIQYELEHNIKGYTAHKKSYLSRYESRIGYIDIPYYDKIYKEWDVMSLYITIENGYYEGIMIDVDLSEIEEREYSNTVQKKIERYIDQIEKVLEVNTMKLQRVATFSNGETIYSQM